MKKTQLLSVLMYFSLLALLLLHVLTLFGFLNPNILWDTALLDTKAVTLAEIFTLGFLVPLTYLFHLCYPRVKNPNARSMATIILRIIAVYFLLELLGSVFASTWLYRIVGISLYGLLTFLTINCITAIQSINKAAVRR